MLWYHGSRKNAIGELKMQNVQCKMKNTGNGERKTQPKDFSYMGMDPEKPENVKL